MARKRRQERTRRDPAFHPRGSHDQREWRIVIGVPLRLPGHRRGVEPDREVSPQVRALAAARHPALAFDRMNAMTGRGPGIVKGPHRGAETGKERNQRGADVVWINELPMNQVGFAEALPAREGKRERGQQTLQAGHALERVQAPLEDLSESRVTVNARVLGAPGHHQHFGVVTTLDQGSMKAIAVESLPHQILERDLENVHGVGSRGRREMGPPLRRESFVPMARVAQPGPAVERITLHADSRISLTRSGLRVFDRAAANP